MSALDFQTWWDSIPMGGSSVKAMRFICGHPLLKEPAQFAFLEGQKHAAAELAALRRDVGLLRAALSRTATAIGNGSAASPDCDLESMCEKVPDEVALETTALRERVKVLEDTLDGISKIGGNLSDDALTTRTGGNDAVQRGIMVCTARTVARTALKGTK